MLAVFLADIDLSVGSGGRVYFHEYRRHPVYQFVDPLSLAEQLIFDTAENQVHDVVGDTSFYPSNVVVVTWQNVSPYSPDRSTNDEVRRTVDNNNNCLLYTSPSPRDRQKSRMPSSA